MRTWKIQAARLNGMAIDESIILVDHFSIDASHNVFDVDGIMGMWWWLIGRSKNKVKARAVYSVTNISFMATMNRFGVSLDYNMADPFSKDTNQVVILRVSETSFGKKLQACKSKTFYTQTHKKKKKK